WRAHGLRYGIPGNYDGDLAAGHAVIANVSRTVLDEARERLRPVIVVNVTASPAVLRERLIARGREDAADVVLRLDRSIDKSLDGAAFGADVVSICNDGALEEAARQFGRVLDRAIRRAAC
ncbi:MAG: phosphonate metabolism protein/1,5-bisphosphokinase (PRPP-forming) PhnN, partial [Rhodospirillales bacterium]